MGRKARDQNIRIDQSVSDQRYLAGGAWWRRIQSMPQPERPAAWRAFDDGFLSAYRNQESGDV